MNGWKRTTAEEHARTTRGKVTALRLYCFLHPPRLIEFYLSPWLYSCRWAWRLPRGRFLRETWRTGARNGTLCGTRLGLSGRGHSEERNYEICRREKPAENPGEAAVLAVYCLSRAPRAAERGSAWLANFEERVNGNKAIRDE